jgi:hypothetical protein
MTEYEQLQLDLEYPVSQHDHYEIELRKGSPPNQEVVGTTKALTVDDAIDLIDSYRELGANRHNVTWKGDEVDNFGDLYGLAEGVIWQIHVTPNLNTELG